MDLDEEYESYFENAWPKAFEVIKELAEDRQEESQKISVKTSIQAPVSRVWECWTEPEHIRQWNAASPDWHCPAAKNDLRTNGRFSYRMEAKDGTHGFDFEGEYDKVEAQRHIAYTMDDGRKTDVHFMAYGDITVVEEIFDPEMSNPLEMQQTGWQAILDNFKDHVEQQQSS
ncbi:polyketide cyclase [Salinimicrobium sp. CDJ15-91]|uniref:Polyketide cyclase n=2 Tax=Salinimicrobium oceani TaxID=2722702 RepID=A0ABX1D0T0_9FLAO|nr:polyketide cyclase [Salinimicrobium oceani]